MDYTKFITKLSLDEQLAIMHQAVVVRVNEYKEERRCKVAVTLRGMEKGNITAWIATSRVNGATRFSYGRDTDMVVRAHPEIFLLWALDHHDKPNAQRLYPTAVAIFNYVMQAVAQQPSDDHFRSTLPINEFSQEIEENKKQPLPYSDQELNDAFDNQLQPFSKEQLDEIDARLGTHSGEEELIDVLNNSSSSSDDGAGARIEFTDPAMEETYKRQQHLTSDNFHDTFGLPDDEEINTDGFETFQQETEACHVFNQDDMMEVEWLDRDQLYSQEDDTLNTTVEHYFKNDSEKDDYDEDDGLPLQLNFIIEF